jgi:hypothetical protein
MESVALRSSNRVCPEGLFRLAKAGHCTAQSAKGGKGRKGRKGRKGGKAFQPAGVRMIGFLQFLQRIRYASASTLERSHFTSVIVRADLTLAAPAENEEPQYDARRFLEIRKEAQR